MESKWEFTVNDKTVLQRIAKKSDQIFHLSALKGILQEEKYCSGKEERFTCLPQYVKRTLQRKECFGKEERFTCLPQYDKGTLQGKDCSGKVEKMPLIPTIK
jgi:hypothetical protein